MSCFHVSFHKPFAKHLELRCYIFSEIKREYRVVSARKKMVLVWSAMRPPGTFCGKEDKTFHQGVLGRS